MKKIFCSLSFIITLTACAPQINNHGEILKQEVTDKIEVEKFTKNDVQNLLGSPTFIAPFDENKWYYIGIEQENFAFYETKDVKQDVLVLSFDEMGILKNKELLDSSEKVNVVFDKDETPVSGHKRGVLTDIVGNIGRFQKEEK